MAAAASLIPGCVTRHDSACDVTTPARAESQTCPTLDLDACEPGPLHGTWDASCTVTVDLICGDVTIGGQWPGDAWSSDDCAYGWAP
jgi:hypothetical protein